MKNRIIKDIRFYESDKENLQGHYPSELGHLFIPSVDTKYIGQRIARKLNEYNFSFGEFDHIYINFSTVLKKDEIKISDNIIDKQIRYIDVGVTQHIFNELDEIDKDSFTKEITFKTLLYLANKEVAKIKIIEEIREELETNDTETVIGFKTKESKVFKIDIGYQIRPNNSSSKIIINYFDKVNNIKLKGSKDILNYEDIYYLIDTISLKDNIINFTSKKSYIAELTKKKYNEPLFFEIKKLEK
jgi:hypothetical protein